jgi:hypothetical protein
MMLATFGIVTTRSDGEPVTRATLFLLAYDATTRVIP